MPTQEPDRRRYAKIIEAAEYLGVTDRTIRDMILDGRLTGYRNGARLVRVDLNELDARMEPFGSIRPQRGRAAREQWERDQQAKLQGSTTGAEK